MGVLRGCWSSRRLSVGLRNGLATSNDEGKTLEAYYQTQEHAQLDHLRKIDIEFSLNGVDSKLKQREFIVEVSHLQSLRASLLIEQLRVRGRLGGRILAQLEEFGVGSDLGGHPFEA